MKHLAALGAVIAALLITTIAAADRDTGGPVTGSTVSVGFAVIHHPDNTWTARIVIAEPPGPPPASTSGLYQRIIERDGTSRGQAISRLVEYLANLVGTADLEFNTVP